VNKIGIGINRSALRMHNNLKELLQRSLSIKLKEEEDGIYKIRKVYVLGEITTDIYEEFQLEAE